MPSIAELAEAEIFSSLTRPCWFASAAADEDDSELSRGWLLMGGGKSDYSESDRSTLSFAIYSEPPSSSFFTFNARWLGFLLLVLGAKLKY